MDSVDHLRIGGWGGGGWIEKKIKFIIFTTKESNHCILSYISKIRWMFVNQKMFQIGYHMFKSFSIWIDMEISDKLHRNL